MFHINVRFLDESVLALERRVEFFAVEKDNTDVLKHIITNHRTLMVCGPDVFQNQHQKETFSVCLPLYQFDKEDVSKISSLIAAYPNICSV